MRQTIAGCLRRRPTPSRWDQEVQGPVSPYSPLPEPENELSVNSGSPRTCRFHGSPSRSSSPSFLHTLRADLSQQRSEVSPNAGGRGHVRACITRRVRVGHRHRGPPVRRRSERDVVHDVVVEVVRRRCDDPLPNLSGRHRRRSSPRLRLPRRLPPSRWDGPVRSGHRRHKSREPRETSPVLSKVACSSWSAP